MKFDAKAVMGILATIALGTCAVLLVLKGDIAHAQTFAALLVPSAAQLTHAIDAPPSPPAAASTAAKAIGAVLVLSLLGGGLSACKMLQGAGPKVLDDAAKACILANATFPNETIRQVCRIEGDVADVIAVIEAVASTPRKQLAEARAVGVEEGRKLAASAACR